MLNPPALLNDLSEQQVLHIEIVLFSPITWYKSAMSLYHPVVMAALLLIAAVHQTAADSLKDMRLPELEQRLEDIDERLGQLANYSLGGGVGAIGYRSHFHKTSHNREWVEINFGKIHQLDEVVLVPAIRRDTENGFQADAFPMHFRLVAGTDPDRIGTVVEEYTCDQGVLPRVAPFIIPCDGIEASWIRVEADELSLRAFDDMFVLQLSEVMVFSGEENVALRCSAKGSSGQEDESPGWDVSYIVDGFLPYVMDAARGSKSVAYLTPNDLPIQPTLTIDLGKSYPVSRIRFHAVDQSDTIPQAFSGDFGIPEHMTVEGANRPDFKDAVRLLDLRYETMYQRGQIMTYVFEEVPCRYIRLTAVELPPMDEYGSIYRQMGFAEIEVVARGKNVARGLEFTTNYGEISPGRPIRHLTDNLNIYGEILPMRKWMQQLAERHVLDVERPLIVQELNRRYIRQKALLSRLGWLIGFLLAGSIILALTERILHQRAFQRHRERIAADLHDELGANLHALGLISDLALSAKQSPGKLDALLQRMRSLTERTGAAARHCTNMLEAQGLYEKLVDDMRHSASRITADLDHEISFTGEEFLQKLKPRKRIDLFLFYKECLINVIRHSGATRVNISLVADKKTVTLTVIDNGLGLNGRLPHSLKRRARILGGQMTAEDRNEGGTTVTLTYTYKKLGALL